MTHIGRALVGGCLALTLAASGAVAVGSGGHAEATATAGCPAAPDGPTGEGPPLDVIDGKIHLAVATPADGSADLELSTVAVRRGGTELDLTVVRTNANRPYTFTTIRRELREMAQRVAAGAEQSWCFQQAPRGTGDLVVRVTSAVTTSGHPGRLVPADPGLRAASGNDPDGVPLNYPDLVDVRYHHGTWIDTNGRTAPVTARFVDGAIELTVPARVLADTTFPATLDPQIIVTPPSAP